MENSYSLKVDGSLNSQYIQNDLKLKLGLIQLDFVLGDIKSNTRKIINYYLENLDLDLIVTSELALSGYILQDDLYKQDVLDQITLSINKIIEVTKNKRTAILLGEVYICKLTQTTLIKNDRVKPTLKNSVYFISGGKVRQVIHKQKLANYDIFNESRYFTSSLDNNNNVIEVAGYNISVVICEDFWHGDVQAFISKGAPDLILSINASPYEENKLNTRLKVTGIGAKLAQAPVCYVNSVGSVDGVVFDGRTFVLDKEGNQVYIASLVEEELITVSVIKSQDKFARASHIITNEDMTDKRLLSKHGNSYSQDSQLDIYGEKYTIIQKALLGYVEDNNIKHIFIGISGGIDSALSAVIVADTLGKGALTLVSMPSAYTSDLSFQIILELSKVLGIEPVEMPIEEQFIEYQKTLKLYSYDLLKGKTLENLQARIRGDILMSISNSLPNSMVLVNSNKSELATGYFTLYGDACGGFALLKDLYKTEVFELAKWRNANFSKFSKLLKLGLISEKCINREPTAELRANQKDSNELMPYSELDKILRDIINDNLTYSEMKALHKSEKVDAVYKMLKAAEYKRKQTVMGVKLSNKSFGFEWQRANTNKIKFHE